MEGIERSLRMIMMMDEAKRSVEMAQRMSE